MKPQYVFRPTPPVENPQVEELFRTFLASGRVSDYDAYLMAEKAVTHESIPCHACGVWHEQLVMGLV